MSELDRIEAERWRKRFEGAERRGHGVLVWWWTLALPAAASLYIASVVAG